MKEKTKEFLKNRIIIFLLGGIVFGTIGVSAATYFESSAVTYDNTESGLISNDVQGAIDELYTECTALPAGEQIIEDGNLTKDEYECRYFFIGANPNNYITFNDETAGWRIISVECDGSIKIMRTANINTSNKLLYWDTSSNNWSRPANLNIYLNNTYYNDLNSTAQSQIVAKDWSIGAVTWDNNDLADQINDENEAKWNGKVALVTVSEYLRGNSNKNSCSSFRLNNYNSSSCINTNWMYINDYWWTLSPCDGTSNRSFDVFSNGYINYYNVNYSDYAVRPVVYLSSDIKITGGDGSQSNPYEISL